jgi:hypothetical protein
MDYNSNNNNNNQIIEQGLPYVREAYNQSLDIVDNQNEIKFGQPGVFYSNNFNSSDLNENQTTTTTTNTNIPVLIQT